jgi:hypothetical protein
VPSRTSPSAYPHKRREIPRRRPRRMTTLGDLILALTEETRRYVKDDEEVYRLVAYMVSDILVRPPKPSHKPAKKWH